MRAVFNFVLFQAVWLVSVTSIAAHENWRGLLLALAVAGLHLWQSRPDGRQEALFMLAVAIAGTCLESAFILGGVLIYADCGQPAFLPPLAISGLWLAFGTLPRGSMVWLAGRPLVQAGLGAFAGPLSYYAGVQLGAASFALPPQLAIAAMALGLGLLMPGIFWLAKRIFGQ